MSLRHDVMSSLRWTAAARVSAQGMSWLITLLVIRLLSPEDYGIMAAAMVVIGLATLLNEMGMVAGLVQSKEIDESLIGNVFGFVLVSNACLVAILFLTAPLVAAYFGQDEVELVVRVLSLMLLISAIGAVPAALLRRELRFKQISIIGFCITVFSNLVTLALAYGGAGVWSLVVGSLVKAALGSVAYWYVTDFRQLPSFRFRRLQGILRFGLNIAAQRIVWYISSQADALIVGRLLGTQMLGFYSVGNHLATLPMTRLMQLVNSVAFPAYAKVQGEKERARDYFLLSIKLLTLISLPIFWGLASVAEPFVSIFLGEQWSQAAFVIALAALAAPARLVDMLLSPMLDGLGRPDIGLRNVLTLALVFPAAVYLGYRFGGFEGLVISAAVSYALVALVNAVRSVRILDCGVGEIFRAVAPSLTCGLLMYGAVYAVKQALVGLESEILQLVILVASGAAVYLGATALINRPAALRVIELARPGGAS